MFLHFPPAGFALLLHRIFLRGESLGSFDERLLLLRLLYLWFWLALLSMRLRGFVVVVSPLLHFSHAGTGAGS